VTITRKRHAFEGRALPVISTIRRRGIHYLLAVLPDGSRSLIPSSWTDYNMQPVGPTDADEALHELGTIGDLLRLRKLVDALCCRPAESASCKESRDAIELGSFRQPRSPNTASGVASDRRSRAPCGNRFWRGSSHACSKTGR
jgi:hypothetical protein